MTQEAAYQELFFCGEPKLSCLLFLERYVSETTPLDMVVLRLYQEAAFANNFEVGRVLAEDMAVRFDV